MGNFDTFADFLDKEFVDKIKRTSSQKVQSVAKEVLRDLVESTPVDTSAALSNWQVGLGAPVGSVIDAYALGEKGSTQGLSSAEAIAVGATKIASHEAGQVIYISNNADYIEDLNNGRSPQQAQPGFVERAVERGRLLAEGA